MLDQKDFLKLSDGNPGALRFLYEMAHARIPESTFEKLKQSGIAGTDIYVLCSDICEGDMNKIVNLIENCPPDLLKDACSRQDYSGKEMVAEFLK